MSEKKKIYKPKPISGFPEWLPETRRAEQQWFDHIRRVFESYGFCSIETPSIEALDVINAKGGDGEADVDKEVYVLERLHKEEGDKEARLALHFDQTIPLARYTAQHFNDLVFPFKRYQMQRVWRGERPQAGRFREFYQCDIDVINIDTLPLHFDAEMPAIIWEILSSLPGMENENIQIRISNRKILIGLLEAAGIENPTTIIRAIDKMEKIGEEKVKELIASELDDPDDIAEIDFLFDVLKNGPIVIPEDLMSRKVKEGLDELSFVLDQLAHLPEDAVKMDLSLVRGLDYYTGTVYETVFMEDPSYGSICSGGRYDDLAGNYINKHLPGVGISIGFSRLFDRIRLKGQLPVSGISPADILVVLPNEEARTTMMDTAKTLRKRGYNVETFHSPSKIKRQLAYAQKKGIPYVWFPPFEDGQNHEVKNMDTGAQDAATPDEWTK
ncbi:MAG: histidine--tRNA ligase [Zetaproteobacteria bacterium]|nr:MAG: histidine--tRNA ligase [Zetaproteobacteria bacterium]